MKPRLLLVIGPSGVGKSTLLRRAMEVPLGDGWIWVMPQKDTTRQLRSRAEAAEFRHVTTNEFEVRAKASAFLDIYHIFGNSYGLPRQPFDSPVSSTLYIQTVPTSSAKRIIGALGSGWSVGVCLLDADLATVRRRLVSRGDPGTCRTIDERMATAGRDRRQVADHVIQSEDGYDPLPDFIDWVWSRID